MNASTAAPAPLAARVSPNLRHAFGGVGRLTIARLFTRGHLLSFLGLLALLSLFGFGVVSESHGSPQYIGWMGLFYVSFLVPIVSFLSAAGLIRDDMKSTTVDYVLIRPVPRPAFVGFRYVAHVAAMQVEFGLALTLLLALGASRHVPGLAAAVPRLLLGQCLLVTAFSAFGFVCGVLTSRYLVLGLIYGGVVELGVGQIPTQLNRLSMTHQVKAMLQPVLPALSSPAETIAAASMGPTIAILLAFAVLSLAIAGAVFALRELSSANES